MNKTILFAAASTAAILCAASAFAFFASEAMSLLAFVTCSMPFTAAVGSDVIVMEISDAMRTSPQLLQSARSAGGQVVVVSGGSGFGPDGGGWGWRPAWTSSMICAKTPMRSGFARTWRSVRP